MGLDLQACPICDCMLTKAEVNAQGAICECPRCGKWYAPGFGTWGVDAITMKLSGTVTGGLPSTTHLKSRLSHIVQRQQRDARYFQLDPNGLEALGLEAPLPNAQEQADSLILWIGDHQEHPAAGTPHVLALSLSAWLGTMVEPNEGVSGLEWLILAIDNQALFDTDWRSGQYGNERTFQLTLKGWARYEELKHRRIASRTAFMAMKFNDPELDSVVENHFRPAVSAAGFELRLLTDGQGAGLIDDQLRIALRRSRFAIVDLTHGNAGAYWEAGFAEGLGRPVIYTCRRDVFATPNHQHRPHFDTNHLVTVIWEPSDIAAAATRLTATIRATLPEEATLG